MPVAFLVQSINLFKLSFCITSVNISSSGINLKILSLLGSGNLISLHWEFAPIFTYAGLQRLTNGNNLSDSKSIIGSIVTCVSMPFSAIFSIAQTLSSIFGLFLMCSGIYLFDSIVVQITEFSKTGWSINSKNLFGFFD